MGEWRCIPTILDLGTREGEWSASRLGRFIPGERVPCARWMVGLAPEPVWTLRRREKSLAPAGNVTPAPYPISRCYTDQAIFFFLWRYSPQWGLGLPPWNSPFHLGFLNLRQTVGLLGRVISSSQGLYLYTNTEKRTHTQILNTHALSGIRTRSRLPSERRQCMPQTARLPWPADQAIPALNSVNVCIKCVCVVITRIQCLVSREKCIGTEWYLLKLFAKT
jgi:hypothetical protein